MPVTREARYLSGVDIGKTISMGDDDSTELVEVEHDKRGCWILTTGPDGRLWNTRLEANTPVTITGKPS